MVKVISNLSNLRKAKAYELKQKQILKKEEQLNTLIKKTVKTIEIPKPVNYSVNYSTELKIRQIDTDHGDNTWASWFLNRFRKK